MFPTLSIAPLNVNDQKTQKIEVAGVDKKADICYEQQNYFENKAHSASE